MATNRHAECIKLLEQAQETETDNRERVREADLFLNKRDGQWEPQIIKKFDGKPRYTFDECTPIVDDIMGEMETMDFDIRVNPSGTGGSKQTAETYEGLIRNIENISGAQFIYNSAARIMVGTGLAGWRVVADYRDGTTFQQDLMIKPIPSFEDNVWFDPGTMTQTAEDADYCFVLSSMTYAKYKAKYPKGSGLSVGTDQQQQAYYHKKPDEIKVGEYLYKVKKYRELFQLSNGMVVENNEDFAMVRDELEQGGITVERSRKRHYYEVYQRLFDGGDWLGDAKRTVFNHIPIIPVFGNFKISENKVIYWGVTEKTADAQRIINYAESRKIEESAMSPKPKTWMTMEQATNPEVLRTLKTLNTNTDPVQFYDHVEGQTPPYQQPALQSNPALMETAQSAQQYIQRTSSTFDEARGIAPAQRSGVAIDKLQAKSDNPKRKWFSAMEVALTQTYKVLIRAIPIVYDTKQEIRLVAQDGTTNTATIKERVIDQQTGQVVELLDLSKGTYDVVCSAGPAFHSRQQETVTAINELAQIDPSILQIGADVLLNNINAPGIDQIAERKRAQMVQQGIIPESQLTREEKAQMAQTQQAQGPSPIEQANLMIAEAQLKETEGRNAERAMKLQIEEQKNQLKAMELQQKADAQQQKALMDSIKAVSEQVKTQADALKTIREAMGADSVVSETVVKAYEGQARDLAETIATN